MKRGVDMVRSYNDQESSQETGSESPNSSNFNTVISSRSPKRSKKSIEKRVVNVPMKEMEGSRHKGDTTPPADSWAWRKYGQKPIKGSPYPRGYYRCTSTKGCPARKQVERSRDDPTMILITYTCEHNHPWPLISSSSSSKNVPKPKREPKPEPEPKPAEVEEEEEEEDDENNNKLMVFWREMETTPSCVVDEFAWFREMETTSSTILESPIFSTENKMARRDDVAVYFPLGEEDESLFADLGELPECTVVLRDRSSVVGSQVEIF